MELITVGSWAPYPRTGEACSGYILQESKTKLLLDCGHTVFSKLGRYIDCLQLDAVFISHFHPDHFVDLYALRHFMRGAFTSGQRHQPLKVFLSDDSTADLLYWQQSEHLDVVFMQENQSVELNELELRFYKMQHNVLTYGIKVQSVQGSLFYTADTCLDEGLIESSRGGDLLLAETTFRSHEKQQALAAGHMTTADAAYWAQQAGVKKLLATHFWPGFDQQEMRQDLQAVYRGQFDLARKGLRVPI